MSSPAHGDHGYVRSSNPQGECHLSGLLAPHLGPGCSPRAGSCLSITCGIQSHGGTVRGRGSQSLPRLSPSALPPSTFTCRQVGSGPGEDRERAFTLKNQSREDQSSRPVGGDKPTECLRRRSPHGPLLSRVPKSQGGTGTPHSRQGRPRVSQEEKVSASHLETLKLETWGPRC